VNNKSNRKFTEFFFSGPSFGKQSFDSFIVIADIGVISDGFAVDEFSISLMLI